MFQQRGFSGLGMGRIADILKIKARSLQHHLSSKNELAQQTFAHDRQIQAERLKAIAAMLRA